MRKWLAPISLTFVIAVVFVFVVSAFRELGHEEYAENVPSVDWLPSSARNVSYFRSYSWTGYEFDIVEAEFLRWAKEWDVAPVTSQSPRTISRYHLAVHKRSTTRPSDNDYEASIAWGKLESVQIEDGWYYGRQSSNGGGVYVGYDRATGRAYYQYSPR